jgi:hypothetical protein
MLHPVVVFVSRRKYNTRQSHRDTRQLGRWNLQSLAQAFFR